jgi:hypothetical protein
MKDYPKICKGCKYLDYYEMITNLCHDNSDYEGFSYCGVGLFWPERTLGHLFDKKPYENFTCKRKKSFTKEE